MFKLKLALTAPLFLICCAIWLPAQQAPREDNTVPSLIKFSGTLSDADGKALSGTVEVTFSLYKEQTGGAALWLETQNVQADSKGHYLVTLGSSSELGLPTEIFAAGEARWVGVQVSGQAEQQGRALLVSVPYALKARDAETLGGKPASAFVVAQVLGAKHGQDAPLAEQPNEIVCSSSTACKKSYVPVFATNGGSASVGSSILFQTANKVGVGTTSPSALLDVNGAAVFRNNLTASGVVTGSSYQIGSNLFAFGSYANENAFLGFGGNTTMSGAFNTSAGWRTLLSNTTGYDNTAVGADALVSNTTGYYNTATGAAALPSNTMGSDNTADGAYAMFANGFGADNTAVGFEALYDNFGSFNSAFGSQALVFNTSGSSNTATGYTALQHNTTGGSNTADGQAALNQNTRGINNTAIGQNALFQSVNDNDNTAAGVRALSTNNGGYSNTAIGSGALLRNTVGFGNTAVGYYALSLNTTGNLFTCIGYECTAGVQGLQNGTAIGAHAVVAQSNSLVLGGTGRYAVKVGIGTTTPSNILTIARGSGHPVSDSWETYSSRRWKTNIKTLPAALDKIERLRGVSYDLKDSGKHEIGVIAEEVGAVIPEVVSYEANGKDASGVDYSRLTALLIEATKEQQVMIRQQEQQIRAQQAAMKLQQTQIKQLSRQVREVKTALTESSRINPGGHTVRAAASVAHLWTVGR